MKRLVVITLTFVMILLLVSCGEPTIQESVPLQETTCEHEWQDATCETPKTCIICNATIGEAAGHQYEFSDCESVGICKVCKAETSPSGHTWVDADCVNPKTCYVCGLTEGEPNAHVFEDDVCVNCGFVNFTTLSYSGTGDKIITGVNLPEGTFVAKIRIDSTRHYDVKYHLSVDDYELLVNNSGEPYVGTVLIKGSSIEAVEDGILEINSEGDWEVTIDMLSGTCGNNIAGTGDTITGLFNGTGNNEVITITIDSTSHYHVRLYEHSNSGTRNDYDLLINDSGEAYSGEVLGKMENGKQYFFEVNAEGDWTICFGEDSVTQYIDGSIQ